MTTPKTGRWRSPIDYELIPTMDPMSFREMRWWPRMQTGIPIPPAGDWDPDNYHPGAFGVLRRHDIHTGVDLYCQPGTKVSSVEDGEVVAVLPFTGPLAGSPWWNDTDAVMIEGPSGVVCYGEVLSWMRPGDIVRAGDWIADVCTVLKKDKGRPRTMLHLELYEHGTRNPVDWFPGRERPIELRDPTSKLLEIAK